jgi:hypothetical protein
MCPETTCSWWTQDNLLSVIKFILFSELSVSASVFIGPDVRPYPNESRLLGAMLYLFSSIHMLTICLLKFNFSIIPFIYLSQGIF